MLNATKFAAVLALAGAMLVPAAPSSAQDYRGEWRGAGAYPEPYTDYYQTSTGPGRAGASGIPESAYSAAVPHSFGGSYAAVGPIQRPILTPREWQTGLRAPDWTAIHGGGGN